MGAQPMMGGQTATNPVDKFDTEVPLDVQDTISAVKFSPMLLPYQQHGQMLACAAWDGSIRVWKLMHNSAYEPRVQVQPLAAQNVQVPVLGICWQVDSPALLMACSDNQIKKWDLASN